MTGANGYTLDVGSGGYLVQSIGLGSSQTSCDVTNLKPDTTYVIQLAAYNSSGENQSNFQVVTTLLAPRLSLGAQVSPTQVDLSWNNVAGATYYIVEEWRPATRGWVELAVVSGSSCAVANLLPGTYDFSVVAVGARRRELVESRGRNSHVVETPAGEPSAKGRGPGFSRSRRRQTPPFISL